MHHDLKDKVIIIAGASSGVGKAATIQPATLGQQLSWHVDPENEDFKPGTRSVENDLD